MNNNPKYKNFYFYVILIMLFGVSCTNYRPNYKVWIQVESLERESSQNSSDILNESKLPGLSSAPENSEENSMDDLGDRTSGLASTPNSNFKEPKVFYLDYTGTHSLWTTAVFCGLTYFIYGGACWAYIALPYESDENMDKSAIQNRIHSIFSDKYSYQMHISTSEILDYSYSPGPVEIFKDEKGDIFTPEELLAKLEEPNSFEEKDQESVASPELDVIEVQNPEEMVVQDGGFHTYLHGLTFGYRVGSAFATSSVKEFGSTYKVASGKSQYVIYTITYRSFAPEGWDWAVSPQYSNQKIKIQDFGADLPTVEVAGSENIPVVVTNPTSGEKIELESFKNAYTISANSISLLVGASYNKIEKAPKSIAFWSLRGELWLGLINYIETKVESELSSAKKKYLDFISSWHGEFNLHYNIPRWSSSIGFHYTQSYQPKVKIPDQMEFRGEGRYNDSKKVFERARLNLEDVEIQTSSFGLSYSYILEN